MTKCCVHPALEALAHSRNDKIIPAVGSRSRKKSGIPNRFAETRRPHARYPSPHAGRFHALSGVSESILGIRATGWRPEPESNRRARICSPLRHHSAIGPHQWFEIGATSAESRPLQPSVRRLGRYLPALPVITSDLCMEAHEWVWADRSDPRGVLWLQHGSAASMFVPKAGKSVQ